MRYECPVCFYPNLEEPPQDFNICVCCGTEFGNDDLSESHEALRSKWVDSGHQWFLGDPPARWSPVQQLIRCMLVGLLEPSVPVEEPSFSVTSLPIPSILPAPEYQLSGTPPIVNRAQLEEEQFAAMAS